MSQKRHQTESMLVVRLFKIKCRLLGKELKTFNQSRCQSQSGQDEALYPKAEYII